MEPALRAVCKDVRIGTILIQTNQLTGEPEVSSQGGLGVHSNDPHREVGETRKLMGGPALTLLSTIAPLPETSQGY